MEDIKLMPACCVRWGSKTFEPSLPGQRSFGERSSFGDRDGRREEDNFSKADSEDRWSRRAPVTGQSELLKSMLTELIVSHHP